MNRINPNSAQNNTLNSLGAKIRDTLINTDSYAKKIKLVDDFYSGKTTTQMASVSNIQKTTAQTKDVGE